VVTNNNSLKISINSKKIETAYGGGNQAANALEDHLIKMGHKIYRKLIPHLDIILIFSSKNDYSITSYNYEDIADYIYEYPNTLVIQRVNSCDEQRGSDLGINSSMVKYNSLADYTIFISKFVKEIFKKYGMKVDQNSKIVLNGGDTNIFYPNELENNNNKIKIITHHWSSNYMKGFDIYERLDQLLNTKPFNDLFEFTYIGNIPLGLNFKNTNIIKPMNGITLANKLREHDIYVTGARNEAAGMHHIEGMLCGLPVLFLNSGALPEYCKHFGVEYSLINFEEKLIEIKNKNKELKQKLKDCHYTSINMATQINEIICELIEKRRITPPKKNNKGKILFNKFAKRPYRKIKIFYNKTKNYYRR